MSVSTHVLDASVGRPAAGVAVRLERRDDSGSREDTATGQRDVWRQVAAGRTDADGRLRDWAAAGETAAGVHRLVFATGEHYARHGIEAFHPEVTVVFRIADPAEHCHVPLLLSPHSYTTYRGS